jgi:PAS domain S-box-containing protein
MSEVSGERLVELQQTEDWFQLVTENVDAVIFLARTDDFEVEYVSPAYEEVYGEPAAALYEDPWSFLEAVHPADRERYREDMAEMVAAFEAGDHAGRYEGEYRLGDEDGATRWIRVERYPVEEDGTVDRFVGIVEDVTERRELERTYRDVFEGVSDGLVVHDPVTGEILEVNDRYSELTGYDRSELVGDDIGIIVTDRTTHSLDVAREHIDRAREAGPQLFEFEGERANGSVFVGEVNLSLVELRGEERVLASVRDVTERKRHERIVRTLHESTERLQNARTREAVCEAAVDAASEVLDLSMPACWLAEGSGDRPALEPVAASESAWSVPGGPGRFDPGTPPYEAFERGETLVYTPSDHREESTLDVGVLVPLGDHGLLGAADPTVEEYDDVVVDAARTLGRHATAALDRVTRAAERRESERRLRTVLERIDEAVLLTDERHLERETTAPDSLTSGYEAIWGRSYDEVLDSGGVLETIYPGDRAAYRETFEGVLEAMDRRESTGGQSVEYRIHRPDGEVRWLRSDVYPLLWDETGHRVAVVTRDVTERRRREREYEQIFDGVQDAITVHDPETGEVVDANAAAHDLFGYGPGELSGLGVGDLSASDEGFTEERGRAVIDEVMETGEAATLEWLSETADGEHRWLEVKGTPAEVGGDPVYVSMIRDVTERKRTERRLQRIADRVDEVVYMASADMTAVHYVSPGYEDIWGQPVERLYEEPFSFIDGIHPEDRDSYRDGMESMLAEVERGDPRDRYEFEYRVERPDGEVRWVEAAAYPLRGPSNTVDRIVGTIRDVTERERRQRTLSSFHDATRDLTEAASREAASGRAVEAAEELLELSLVSVHLYEEDSGALEPAAVTDSLRERADALPAFVPGDGRPWEVFVEGETALGDGGSGPVADVYGPEVPAPALVLPLGQHGVMLVGAPDHEFEGEAVELAQILAATLEAALNHVRGRDELAEREERLADTRERADRLERLNTVIREIEQATVDHSSRDAIEESLCERLTAVEEYAVAWVLEPDAAATDLRPRTRAGESGPVGSAPVELPADRPADHPAAVAYETASPAVVQHLATGAGADGLGGAGDEWRKRLLRAGYQSLVAVPLAYDGTVHGVACVVADDPAAFDDRTESVLAELGRSVGHAVAVLERQAALESDTTVELEFETDDESLPFVALAAETGGMVSLERTVRRSDGSFSAFYSVEDVAPDRALEVASAVRGPESVTRVSVDEETPASLLEVTTEQWFGSPFAERGAVLRTATATGSEPGRLVVEAPRRTDVRSLVESFRESYPATELVAQRTREWAVESLLELRDRLDERLTDRQMEVVETAYSAGYFAWPRENSGEEIASLLGVTQPTFNKHLRTAEREAFGMLLERTGRE